MRGANWATRGTYPFTGDPLAALRAPASPPGPPADLMPPDSLMGLPVIRSPYVHPGQIIVLGNDAIVVHLESARERRQRAHWRRKAGRPRTAKRRRRGR